MDIVENEMCTEFQVLGMARAYFSSPVQRACRVRWSAIRIRLYKKKKPGLDGRADANFC